MGKGKRRSSSSSSSSSSREGRYEKLKRDLKKLKKGLKKRGDRNSRSSTHSKSKHETLSCYSGKPTTISGRREPTVSVSRSRSNSSQSNQFDYKRQRSVSRTHCHSIHRSSKSRSHSKEDEDKNSLDIHADIDERYLPLIGRSKRERSDRRLEIHDDIAKRWSEILSAGLDREKRSELMDMYPPPGNCLTVAGPQLNPEIAITLGETNIKKDKYQMDFQHQLGCALSAIGSLITNMFTKVHSKEIDLMPHLKDLGAAAQLIADVHHSISKSRRSFVNLSKYPTLRIATDKAPIDSMLYGEQLSDKIKSTKSLLRATEELKKDDSKPKSYRHPLKHRRPPLPVKNMVHRYKEMRGQQTKSQYNSYRPPYINRGK